MRRLVLLFFVFHFCVFGNAQISNAKLKNSNNGYYIVEGNQTYKVDSKLLLAKLKSGINLREGIKGSKPSPSGIVRVFVPDSVELDSYTSYLKQTGDFEFVDYNAYYNPYLTPNDTYISDQWYLNAINIYDTWNITTGSSTIKVAVIDNGVSSTHPDLGSNLSPYEGYDYVDNVCPSTTGARHGTMVAGVLGAKTNNYIGIAGVAGGNNSVGVTIIPYRTNYSNDQVISALEDAVSKGVKVVNMSFGGGYNDALDQAITYAYNSGVTIVCASGNGSSSSLPFPASHNYTIAVGASNESNEKCYWSNYGNGIDLIAPGENIKSTDYNSGYNSYFTDSGTSFAAPQVAGVAALMLSVNPTLTPSQIRSKLRSTCTKLSGYSYNASGWNTYVGYGLLNAYAAVCSALSASEIVGPPLVYTSGQYDIVNLPSGVTVSWSLSDNYYNTGYNLIIRNYPSVGHCLIVRDPNHDLMNATLTAEIKYNGVTVQTLQKTGIYAYDDFWGQYSSGNLSGNINYTHYFNVRTNYSTTVTSPNLYGATVTYDSSGATPSAWGFHPDQGLLYFTNSTPNTPVVLNVTDGCGNSYVLYAFATNQYGMNISYGDNSITVSLNEEGESSASMDVSHPWTLEVSNALTGTLMATRSSMSSRSTTISTAGWLKGMYVVRVTIGNEVLTEKVVIK